MPDSEGHKPKHNVNNSCGVTQQDRLTVSHGNVLSNGHKQLEPICLGVIGFFRRSHVLIDKSLVWEEYQLPSVKGFCHVRDSGNFCLTPCHYLAHARLRRSHSPKIIMLTTAVELRNRINKLLSDGPVLSIMVHKQLETYMPALGYARIGLVAQLNIKRSTHLAKNRLPSKFKPRRPSQFCVISIQVREKKEKSLFRNWGINCPKERFSSC